MTGRFAYSGLCLKTFRNFTSGPCRALPTICSSAAMATVSWRVGKYGTLPSMTASAAFMTRILNLVDALLFSAECCRRQFRKSLAAFASNRPMRPSTVRRLFWVHFQNPSTILQRQINQTSGRIDHAARSQR